MMIVTASFTSLIVMRENSFFIVKLAYGKESLQCRCPMATIRTVGDLHR